MRHEQLQEFIKKLYPIQPIEFRFDDNCIAKMEILFEDGKKQFYVNIFYKKMLVIIKNMEPFYIEISGHNEKLKIDEAIEKIVSCDIYIPEHDLQSLRNADVLRNLYRPDHGRDAILDRISEYSKKTSEEILKLAGLPN